MVNYKRILVTGGLGQIGSELSLELQNRYGTENVIITDIKNEIPEVFGNNSIYIQLDVLDYAKLEEIIKKYQIDAIFHLAAILSGRGEENPFWCWDVNMNGNMNIFKVAIQHNIKRVFIPSSMAAWGSGIPKENVPQDSVLRPTSMYGVTKVAGERLCEYMFHKYNLDCRGLRYPGIISSEALPGGGTTDYAVEIFYEAIKNKKYTSYIDKGTKLPMMYMPDCIKATIMLMEADINNLTCHGDYNLAAFSFTPEEIAEEIKKIIPEFQIDYKPDFRQKIAESWPSSIDDSVARRDWGWSPDYDIATMTKDMIEKLSIRLK